MREVLLDKGSTYRRLFNKGLLEKMVSRNIRGNRDLVYKINEEKTAELIQRFLIEEV